MFSNIKVCYQCPHHLFKNDNGNKISYCKKEGCYPIFTKCIAKQSLEMFIYQNKSTAFTNTYISNLTKTENDDRIQTKDYRQ